MRDVLVLRRSGGWRRWGTELHCAETGLEFVDLLGLGGAGRGGVVGAGGTSADVKAGDGDAGGG